MTLRYLITYYSKWGCCWWDQCWKEWTEWSRWSFLMRVGPIQSLRTKGWPSQTQRASFFPTAFKLGCWLSAAFDLRLKHQLFLGSKVASTDVVVCHQPPAPTLWLHILKVVRLKKKKNHMTQFLRINEWLNERISVLAILFFLSLENIATDY